MITIVPTALLDDETEPEMKLAEVRHRHSPDAIDHYYALGLWRDEVLFDAIERGAAAMPDKVFISDATTSIDYLELRDRVLRVATALARRGVVRGDRVLVQIPNWTEFAVITGAIARLGAVLVPFMPIYRRDETAYVASVVEPRAMFTFDSAKGFDHAAMSARIALDVPSIALLVAVRDDDRSTGLTPFEELLASDIDEELIGPGAGPDDPFVIVFTSGTTARPKGCVHTYNNVACGSRAIGEAFDYTDADVQFGPSPVTHTTGLVTSIVMPLLHGATSHLIEAWDPEVAAQRIAQHGCTACVSATTFLQTLVDAYDPTAHDLSSLRVWTAAGSPIPGPFVEHARAVLPSLDVLSLYGRSETITCTACAIHDDPARSITSDGRALPHQEVRILDEHGDEVTRGMEGDIAYRGPMVMLEYIDQPEETRAVFTRDGFCLSGDLGRMDEDGYVRVSGRRKDVVVRGGLAISVREVEDHLVAHPAIRAAAVVSMPDDRLGERACAFVEVARGATAPELADLRGFLLGHDLAIQKVPERLEIVDALPMTATGTVQKHLLRARIAEQMLAEKSLLV